MSPVVRHEQVVAAPRQRVVRFFHDVTNLPRVSPRIPVVDVPAVETRVRTGLVVPVRLRLGPLHHTLRTTIVRVDSDGTFTDRIEGRPFVSWEHTHRFETVGRGTRIIDEIAYTPSPWFDALARMGLAIMFSLRRRAVRRVLG
jgi:ligand-binding SRPBCC domain-containing protein